MTSVAPSIAARPFQYGDGDSGHAKAAATAAKAAAYVAQQRRAETGLVEARVISRPIGGGVSDDGCVNDVLAAHKALETTKAISEETSSARNSQHKFAPTL